MKNLGLCLALFVSICCCGPINWGNVTTIASSNAGWGRAMIQDKEGDTLLTYTEYDHPLPNGCDAGYSLPGPEVKVVYITSTSNNWNNFSLISYIPSPDNHIQEQSMMLQLSSGNILLVMRNRQPDCNWFGLPVVVSSDAGKTWQFLSQLDQTTTPTGLFNRGLWEPFLYTLPNGCIAGFYADETHANSGWNQIVGERVSCDGGKTWGTEIYAAALQDNVSRPGMPGVARLANGQTIFVFEVCGTDNCNIHYKISPDGTIWESGLGTRIPNQTSGPYVQVTPSGRVLVTSACTNMISISDDNGNTWYLNSNPAWSDQCANGNPDTWPAIYNTAPNEVGVVVSGLSSSIQVRFGTY